MPASEAPNSLAAFMISIFVLDVKLMSIIFAYFLFADRPVDLVFNGLSHFSIGGFEQKPRWNTLGNINLSATEYAIHKAIAREKGEPSEYIYSSIILPWGFDPSLQQSGATSTTIAPLLSGNQVRSDAGDRKCW
jgi:hypothetical protein